MNGVSVVQGEWDRVQRHRRELDDAESEQQDCGDRRRRVSASDGRAARRRRATAATTTIIAHSLIVRAVGVHDVGGQPERDHDDRRRRRRRDESDASRVITTSTPTPTNSDGDDHDDDQPTRRRSRQVEAGQEVERRVEHERARADRPHQGESTEHAERDRPRSRRPYQYAVGQADQGDDRTDDSRRTRRSRSCRRTAPDRCPAPCRAAPAPSRSAGATATGRAGSGVRPSDSALSAVAYSTATSCGRAIRPPSAAPTDEMGEPAPAVATDGEADRRRDRQQQGLVDELRVSGEQHGGGHADGRCDRTPRALGVEHRVDGHEQQWCPRDHEDLFELHRLRQTPRPRRPARSPPAVAPDAPDTEPAEQPHHADAEQHEVQRDEDAHRPVRAEEQRDQLRCVERARRRVAEVGNTTEDQVVEDRQSEVAPRLLGDLDVRPGVRVRVEPDDVPTRKPERPAQPQRDDRHDQERRRANPPVRR